MSGIKWKRPRLFFQYLFSYLCITFLSCSLIGFSLFSVFLHDLEQENRQSNLHKLTLAAADMENQLDILEEISYKLASQVVYLPTYLEQNPYYEMEMLEDFKTYQNMSPLTQEYFLLYHKNSGRLYRSTGTTVPTELYIRRVLGISGAAELAGTLSSVEQFSVFDPEEGPVVLFAFPVRMGGTSGNATLCFAVERREFLQRITDATGGFDGAVELFLEDRSLAADPFPLEERLVELASEDAPGSRFRLVLHYPRMRSFYRFSGFRGLSLGIVIVSAALLAGVAVFTAYRNVKPIRRIKAGLEANGFPGEPGRNELDDIEDAVFQALESNAHANEQLTQQMRELRSQALRLLLNGDSSEEMVQRLRLLGLPLANDFYAVLLIRFQDREILPDDPVLDWLADLSDGSIRFYPVCDRQKGGSIAIVLELTGIAEAQEALELTEALLETKGLPAELGLGGAYEALSRLPASYLEATADCRPRAREDSIPEGDLLTYDNRYVLWMLRAVRAGDFEEARQRLDDFVAELECTAPSFLLQRYIFSDVMVTLIAAGRELNIPIGKQQAGKILSAQDLPDFRESVLAILEKLCYGEQRGLENEEQDFSRRILAYIAEHCLEYDLSLERLSQEFGRSVSVLSRVIKQAAGENYKDYVILLKIEHAKRLLKEGCSVTETCEQVGYSNLSHFIRTFKQVAGSTPSAYKKQAGSRMPAGTGHA